MEALQTVAAVRAGLTDAQAVLYAGLAAFIATGLTALVTWVISARAALAQRLKDDRERRDRAEAEALRAVAGYAGAVDYLCETVVTLAYARDNAKSAHRVYLSRKSGGVYADGVERARDSADLRDKRVRSDRARTSREEARSAASKVYYELVVRTGPGEVLDELRAIHALAFGAG